MAKLGYKDHFGNTAAGFDRINRQNKTVKVDNSLAAQIKRADAFVEEERSDYGILREQTEGDD